MDKLKAGDEHELKRLYLFFFPHFLFFALNYIPQKEVCRDIVQEVFIAYWEKRVDFDDIISLKVFFYRSIRNRCYNEIRNKHSHEYVEISTVDKLFSNNVLEDNVVREEVAMIIRQEISKLSPKAREILHLSMQDMSNQEIANYLSLSVNTIKTHKLHAYAELRRHLKDIYILIAILSNC